MNKPYSLNLEQLTHPGADGRIRVTLRQEGRTLGYAEEWPYPGAALLLIIRVIANFMPMLERDGKIDERVELNAEAARVMAKPRRKGAFLGVFTDPHDTCAKKMLAMAAPGDVFILAPGGRSHLYKVDYWARQESLSTFFAFCKLLESGTQETVEAAAFRYAKVGACCQYPPVRKFWEWTPRGLSSVRYKLRPFEAVNVGYSWDNGEGVSYRRFSYCADWHGVQCQWATGGRDCDGVQRDRGEDYAKASELASFPPSDTRDTPRPNWIATKDTEHYDQYAEAFGY